MPYVSSRELLLDAREKHYAVGAFNVENMEMMLSVLAAAEAEQSPVILQTTPSTLKYAPTTVFAAMARAIELGVCKVNFATELRAAYTAAVRACLDADASVYDPKKFGNPAREAVTELVIHRIRTCLRKI